MKKTPNGVIIYGVGERPRCGWYSNDRRHALPPIPEGACLEMTARPLGFRKCVEGEDDQAEFVLVWSGYREKTRNRERKHYYTVWGR